MIACPMIGGRLRAPVLALAACLALPLAARADQDSALLANVDSVEEGLTFRACMMSLPPGDAALATALPTHLSLMPGLCAPGVRLWRFGTYAATRREFSSELLILSPEAVPGGVPMIVFTEPLRS